MEKKLKIALCILVIILICVIAFVGVYSKGEVEYKGSLPEYLLGSEFTGKRVTYFEISDETEEKIYDKDGNEVEEIPEDSNEEDYTKETMKVNPDENMTEENYKKVKKIFDGRLKEIGAEDYLIRLDKNTGNLVVELADDSNTDTFLQYLQYKGDFAMKDAEDGTVLIDKSDVKKASVVYGSTSEGSVTVYLDIKFNKEGTKKLAEVSKEYIKVEANSDENSNNENGENEESTVEQKQVTMTIEGVDLVTTYFGEEMTGGELTLAIGSATDTASAYEYAKQVGIFSMLINNDTMPLTYTIHTSEHASGIINEKALFTIIIVLAIIVILVILYLIIKYKMDGALCGISFISAIAILLLLVRYTKTTITLGGIASVAILIAVETFFILNILNNIKKVNSKEEVSYATTNIYLKRLDMIIALLIIAIVFTFMPQTKIYSIGMTLFYGIISIAISNLAFMRTMLIARREK